MSKRKQRSERSILSDQNPLDELDQSESTQDEVYSPPETLQDLDADVYGEMDSAIVPKPRFKNNGELQYYGARMTSTGLVIPETATQDDYTQIGRFILSLTGTMQWSLGDWLNYGENRLWGETYRNVAEEFGYKEKTLRDYAYVCRNVEMSIRIDTLSFAHHQVVAKFHDDPDLQLHWLSQAANHNWSVKELREAIKLSERKDDAKDPTPSEIQAREYVKQSREIGKRWVEMMQAAESGKRPKPTERKELLEQVTKAINYLDELREKLSR